MNLIIFIKIQYSNLFCKVNQKHYRHAKEKQLFCNSIFRNVNFLNIILILVSSGGYSDACHWLLGCLFQLGVFCILHQTKVSQDISQVI